MPIYEYECEKCKTTFETIVSINSTEDVSCKHCGSMDTRKLMSASSLKVGSKTSDSSGCAPRGGFS